jgi:hypothetical protein
MDYTEEMIKLSAEKAGIDMKGFDMEQVKMGMAVELEHGSKNAELNVTGDDPVATLKITLAHLEEVPDYYTKLSKYVEQPEEEKVEERYKLTGFDNYTMDLDEDGEGAPAVGGPAVGATSLAAVPGMGAPVYAGRGTTGSGDVPSPPAFKKKKKKRVKSFTQFIDKK